MTTSKPFVPEWLRPAGAAGRRSGGFLPDWARDGAEGAEGPGRGGKFLPDWVDRGSAGAKAPRGDGIRPLVIKGGHCVLPYAGIVTEDILIEGGRIRATGRDISTEGREVVRAEGKFVLPGLVDPHVHAGIFAPFDEEIASETASALANGVTTIGLYLSAKGSYLSLLEDLESRVAASSRTDVFVHLVLFNRAQVAELPLYASRFGVRSFKVYMAGIPGLIPSADEAFMLDAMEAVADLGEGAVLNLHAENSSVLAWADERTRKSHPEGDLSTWEQTHPAFAEREAIQRALVLAERSGAKLYFVHVSAAQSVAFLRRSRAEARGRFYAETTSPYLSTTFDSPQGKLALMSPPVRSEEDRRALWAGLADDTLDSIGTDHTPLTVAQKTGDRAFWDTLPGYPAIGTHLPLLLDGARKNGLPIERLVEKACANPARIFGIYPRKGAILVGSDADLVIVDLARIKEISPATARSRADFALHQGEKTMGWPVAIAKGGRMLYPDDPALDLSAFAGAEYLRRY